MRALQLSADAAQALDSGGRRACICVTDVTATSTLITRRVSGCRILVAVRTRNYPLITSTIFLSEGFTITSFFCTIAKS